MIPLMNHAWVILIDFACCLIITGLNGYKYCFYVYRGFLVKIVACAAGSFSNAGDTFCTSCPENSSSKPASKSCYCGSGYYKVNKTCKPCPANSQSLQSGATVCDCISGYYRTSFESASDPCTSEFVNVVVFNLNVACYVYTNKRFDGHSYKVYYLRID